MGQEHLTRLIYGPTRLAQPVCHLYVRHCRERDLNPIFTSIHCPIQAPSLEMMRLFLGKVSSFSNPFSFILRRGPSLSSLSKQTVHFLGSICPYQHCRPNPNTNSETQNRETHSKGLLRQGLFLQCRFERSSWKCLRTSTLSPIGMHMCFQLKQDLE